MDARIELIFDQEMKGDKSFTDKENFFTILSGGINFPQSEVRKIFYDGIKRGIEIGLNRASIDGQRIEINSNTISIKNKEFLEKFYKLAEEYKCAIQYHPILGMIVVDRDYGFG